MFPLGSEYISRYKWIVIYKRIVRTSHSHLSLLSTYYIASSRLGESTGSAVLKWWDKCLKFSMYGTQREWIHLKVSILERLPGKADIWFKPCRTRGQLHVLPVITFKVKYMDAEEVVLEHMPYQELRLRFIFKYLFQYKNNFTISTLFGLY